MNNLYLIRGIPGSGKTTLAYNMKACGMVQHVFEADMFMVNASGKYEFDPTKLQECHRKCQQMTKTFLGQGASVAVTNTFTRLWEMKPYIDMGHPFTVIRCEGNYGSIHNVPVSVVNNMRNRFEEYTNE